MAVKASAPKISALSFIAALCLLSIGAARAQAMQDEVAWIAAPAGRHVSKERLRELTLLKAAEMAQARGFTHFAILNSAGAPVTGTVALDHFALRDVYGGAAASIYQPAVTPSPFIRGNGILVRFCNDADDYCPGIRARSVFLNFEPQHGYGK